MSVSPLPSVVKRFEVTNLKVKGANLMKSPVFKDLRGSLYEAFHCLKMETTCSIYSILSIYPPRKTVYGPVKHEGEEFIYLIRGKLWTALYDEESKVYEELTIVPGNILRIPSYAVHAFLSMEDDTIFHVVRTTGPGKEERFALDAFEAFAYPDSEKPLVQARSMSQKAPEPERPMFAVMGSNGMIGSAFVREMDRRGWTWVPLRSRLHEHERIRNELMAIRPTVSVLIAAGVGTRPNTKWCEDHRMETIDANVTGQLAIVDICKKLGIHCTLIGTCGFYHYDEEHPLGSGKGYTEDAVPDYQPNFYYKMRAFLEKLLDEAGAMDNVLNLRALFPFDFKVTSASLVGKLLRFQNINCIPTSMTVLPALVPLALDMMKDKEVGHVNWVCEGTATNGDVLKAYKEIVDPTIVINEVEMTQEESRSRGNSAAYVIPERLNQKFGSENVPKVNDAIRALMELVKADKATSA